MGSPAADFDTWIDDSSQLYQGKTDKTGSISIVGAHNGDTIRVHKDCGGSCSYSGTTTANCSAGQLAAGSLQLNLTQDPFALAVQVKPSSDGTTVEITAQASTSLPAAPSIQIRQAGSLDPITVALTFDGTAYTGSAALNPALELHGYGAGGSNG